MNLAKTLLATLLVAVLAASALAQGGGGRGQGQGLGGMMMMGGGSRTGLLMRRDVAADIKLTDEQKSSLEKIQAEAQETMRNRIEEMRANGGGFDRDAMRAEMEAFQKSNDEKIKAVLSTQQWNRLGQIQIQLAGNRAVMMPDVQKALGMTKEQIQQLESLRQNQEAANADLMQRMRDGELDREQMTEISKKNNEIMNAEIAKVITPEQAQALKKLGGEPFKADPNESNRRGGGGG